MKLNKSKCQIPGRGNPSILGEETQDSSPAERKLEALIDGMLNVRKLCAQEAGKPTVS